MVKTPNGPWFGKYELTQAQWEAMMGDNPAHFKGADNPVENVSWHDCQCFLEKLNGCEAYTKSGLVFRLPTEEEWEYACRAGATGDYCRLADGTEITEATLGGVAWFDENSDEKTHPVGRKKPNAFGLYDMHGNVQEWTETRRYYDKRLCLGGSWGAQAGHCESSFRVENSSHCSASPIGFRLCASGSGDEEEADRVVRENATRIAEEKRLEAAKPIVEKIVRDMVQIPGKDYKMGKYEVTQAQWKAVMGSNPSVLCGADNPVEDVSRVDCQSFLEKLNALPSVKKSRLVFRLPTDEEWIYACRAGATGMYCKLADGTEITEATLDGVAWFDDNSDGKTHPVGQKKPNAFGLYDMHGNVREITERRGLWDVGRGGCCGESAKDCIFSDECKVGFDEFFGFRLCADNRDVLEKIAAKRRAQEANRLAQEANRLKPIAEKIAEDMVQIPGKDYKMGKYEVTQAQWKAVMGSNPSFFKGADHPVENVSWNDCQEFLEKLNRCEAYTKSGLVFRLPTGEEWEYACRAGATGDYCKLADGTEITKDTLGRVAWFTSIKPKTDPVGQKEPNAFGLYDMHGNVWERTQTAVRGGSYNCMARYCESSFRVESYHGVSPIGFRLCATQSPAAEETHAESAETAESGSPAEDAE